MLTAHERATLVVDKWLQESRGLPITLSLNRLGLAIAEAIAAAEDAAFERGRAAAILDPDVAATENAPIVTGT